MTKRVVGTTAFAALLAAAVFASYRMPPVPFTDVVLRGDAVVATVRPNADFLLLRSERQTTESISGREPLRLLDGESALLNAARETIIVKCRVSPSPPVT